MKKEEEKLTKQMGVYIMIPFILAVPPILGWWIGSWIDEKWGTYPYFMFIMILFGCAAGIREFYRIIKRFSDEP